MPKILVHPSLDTQLASLAKTMPHALIISGNAGRGSGTIAQMIAKNAGHIHAVIEPQKKQPSGSYAVDLIEGSVITDDIRELYTTTRSKATSQRVITIDTNGRPFTPGAQNAFLKLLEEPPARTSFIIAVHSLDQLLPTITSRAQILQLPAITAAQSSDLLDSLKIFDETTRSRLLFIASGCPAELTRLATNASLYEARVQTVQSARRVLESTPYQRIAEILHYKDNRPQALLLITDMIHQLELTYKKSPTADTAALIDHLITAGDRIKAYGNIPLQLINVFLSH